MDKTEDALFNVAKKVRDNLADERNILINRLELFKSFDDSKFMPINPNKDFEENMDYVMNEKDLTINSIQMHIDKLEGQIIGQEELIFKMSDEGESEHQRQLDMIQENSELKSKLAETELILKQIEENENGEEEISE